MKENWRQVVGFEDVYSVSSLGRIRRDRPGKSTRVDRILKPHVRHFKSRPPRATITLHFEGKKATNGVHYFVMMAFVGPRPEGKEVNHKDGNPLNNSVGNLEYCTRTENMKHAYKLGLVKLKLGVEHHLAKLTVDQVKVIRSCHAPNSVLARAISVSPATIRKVRKGITWAHVK